jgi:Tol biopolymer transport system component
MSHRFCPRPLSRLAARAALAGVLLIVPAIAASAGAEPVACQKGRIVFSRFSPTWPDIYTMNACGQAVTRLTFNGGHFAKLSPNGELIAFSGPDPGASTSDIWIMRVDGSDLQDITNSPDRNDAFPAWSPDGQELAWSSEPSGSQAGQLFVMNLHSYAPHAITQPFQPPEPANASWSPDGRRIVFDEFPVPPALGQLWTVDPNGHDLRAITPTYLDAFAPDWGPNGLIAFSSGASSPQSHLWTMYPDGADLRQLTTDPAGASSEIPAFSPNGNWLTYTHILPSGASSIWKLKISGANQTALTAGTSDEYSDWGPAQ